MAQKLNACRLFLLVKWHIKYCRSDPQTRSWGNCPGNQTCACVSPCRIQHMSGACASVYMDPMKHGTQWKALPLLGGTCKASELNCHDNYAVFFVVGKTIDKAGKYLGKFWKTFITAWPSMCSDPFLAHSFRTRHLRVPVKLLLGWRFHLLTGHRWGEGLLSRKRLHLAKRCQSMPKAQKHAVSNKT